MAVFADWINCKILMPPKTGEKFLFKYYYGIGLGQYGQCYTEINGNSERTHNGYVLVLHPCEILNGDSPFQWDEDKMLDMEVSWMSLP